MTKNNPRPARRTVNRASVVAENLRALIGEEPVNSWAKARGLAQSTVRRVVVGEISPTEATIELLAEKSRVKPHELLMPGLADLMYWPFKRVARERVLDLSAEDLAYLDGVLEGALTRLESAAAPAVQVTEQARMAAISNTGRPAPHASAPDKLKPKSKPSRSRS